MANIVSLKCYKKYTPCNTLYIYITLYKLYTIQWAIINVLWEYLRCVRFAWLPETLCVFLHAYLFWSLHIAATYTHMHKISHLIIGNWKIIYAFLAVYGPCAWVFFLASDWRHGCHCPCRISMRKLMQVMHQKVIEGDCEDCI